MRPLILGAALCAAAFLAPGLARAGAGQQPAAGSTTSLQPAFVVELDAGDSSPTVYVSTSSAVNSDGTPVAGIGSCVPTTPTGQANAFSCSPAAYSNNGSASTLAPGTYYWWLTYAQAGATTVSGPFMFTAAAPVAPSGVSFVSPTNGATTSATPLLTFTLPANVAYDVYLAATPTQLGDGTPAATPNAHCNGSTTAAGTYTCAVQAADGLAVGKTYYWWLVVTANGSSFTYDAYSLTVGTVKPPVRLHTLGDEPVLPSSTHYTGKSIKQSRLSHAAYALSKALGSPKSIAVACWSEPDWESISGDNPESGYTILGFFTPQMPHWLQLSPGICHTLETLLYKTPKFPNRFTANAVDTLTHEMIHALGVHDEAETECFAMQLSWVTAESLGLPTKYSDSLSRLTLANYSSHPPRYINRFDCRENGAWDLFKGRPSLPWHDFQV